MGEDLTSSAEIPKAITGVDGGQYYASRLVRRFFWHRLPMFEQFKIGYGASHAEERLGILR
jgi:hypothetical protein